jgi:hypothetical protein
MTKEEYEHNYAPDPRSLDSSPWALPQPDAGATSMATTKDSLTTTGSVTQPEFPTETPRRLPLPAVVANARRPHHAPGGRNASEEEAR